MTPQQVISWITLGVAVFNKGQAAYDAIKAAAQSQGVEADWALLDQIIADAARRKALAEADAKG